MTTGAAGAAAADGSQVPELVFSKHALERMAEMHVRKDECRSARSFPVREYWSPRHQSVTYQGRRIAIGVKVLEEGEDAGKELVTTVLWVDADVYAATGSKRERWEAGRRSRWVS